MSRPGIRRLRGGMASALALAGAICPVPAAAQRDPLGLGREFGAYANPERAAAMVAECEAQARAVEVTSKAFLDFMRRYLAEREDYWKRIDEVNSARAAVEEAERSLTRLAGPEADRFTQNVLAPRRERYTTLSNALPTHTSNYDSYSSMAARAADTVMTRLRAAGVPETDFAAPATELSRRARDRCTRMRAWAQLGSRGSVQLPPAAPTGRPGSWTEAALRDWTGRWSCRWRSTVAGVDLNATVAAKTSAWARTGGAIRVHFSTDSVSGWSGYRPSHIFSPLEVTSTDPRRGQFANRDGLGEDRVRIDAIDSAELVSGGLVLVRRYGQSPNDGERLECSPAG